jgi:hypothetical protein
MPKIRAGEALTAGGRKKKAAGGPMRAVFPRLQGYTFGDGFLRGKGGANPADWPGRFAGGTVWENV